MPDVERINIQPYLWVKITINFFTVYKYSIVHTYIWPGYWGGGGPKPPIPHFLYTPWKEQTDVVGVPNMFSIAQPNMRRKYDVKI